MQSSTLTVRVTQSKTKQTVTIKYEVVQGADKYKMFFMQGHKKHFESKVTQKES